MSFDRKRKNERLVRIERSFRDVRPLSLLRAFFVLFLICRTFLSFFFSPPYRSLSPLDRSVSSLLFCIRDERITDTCTASNFEEKREIEPLPIRNGPRLVGHGIFIGENRLDQIEIPWLS